MLSEGFDKLLFHPLNTCMSRVGLPGVVLKGPDYVPNTHPQSVAAFVSVPRPCSGEGQSCQKAATRALE